MSDVFGRSYSLSELHVLVRAGSSRNETAAVMSRRPTMGPRDRVRVEFGLSPEVAEATYRYAKLRGLSLSEAGTRLLQFALNDETENQLDNERFYERTALRSRTRNGS